MELPPGLLEKNAELGSLPVPPDVQTREQLEAIVKEARMPQAMVRGPAHDWPARHHPMQFDCMHIMHLIVSCCHP